MSSAICTLFERDYHRGAAALVNSLVTQGFRGDIYAGYRGSLPPWTSQLQRISDEDFLILDGCCLRFKRLDATVHLTHYKPQFMSDLFSENQTVDSLFYFDPDIVIKCRWGFFEDWISCGVTIVEDVNGRMPATHPFRSAWTQYAASIGVPVQRNLDTYFNAGFLGIKREWTSVLRVWQSLIEKLAVDRDLSRMAHGDLTQPFNMPDQDALNLALMCSDVPISALSGEQMDFFPGGYVMSHAIGGSKPWRRKMLWSALGGLPPRATDKLYWKHTQSPIQVYSRGHLALKRVDLRLGAAVGRFLRRS